MSKTQKTALFGLAGVGLLVLLVMNIGASQLAYAPVMYSLVSMRDPASAREVLANLEGTDLEDVYAQQSVYLNSHFDNIFAREVSVAQLNSDKAIDYYEGLLTLNTENPQLLVKLGLLYGEKGGQENIVKSAAYLKKAREIDPWVVVE